MGGQIGFATGHADNSQTNPSFPDTKNTSFNISPAFGKAVKDNLVVGADLYYNYGRYENIYTQLQKNKYYGAGFFVRSYKSLGKDFYLFGQARAGVNYYYQQYSDMQTVNNNGNSKGYSIQVAVYPGVAYSVSKKFQLEAGFNNLGYIEFDHTKQTSDSPVASSSVTNGFSVGSSLSSFSGFTVGFRVLLN